MLSVGKGVFIQLPDDVGSGQRLLHPAKIVAAGDGLYTAELEETGLPIDAGMEVVLFYEIRGEFTQQQARIDVVMEEPAREGGDSHRGAPLIGLQTLGEPCSAEHRQISRVSTLTTGLSARVGQEECPVLDLSAAGLAVTGSGAWVVGDRLPVCLLAEGEAHAGFVMVQSIRTLRDGRIRYGLLCLSEKGSTLKRGLERLSASIQRQQMRRLMGAG